MEQSRLDKIAKEELMKVVETKKKKKKEEPKIEPKQEVQAPKAE